MALERSRASPRAQRVLHRRDVPRRMHEAQQLEEAADGPLIALLQRAREQAGGVDVAGHEQVVVEGQGVEGAPGLRGGPPEHGVLVDRQLRMRRVDAQERVERLEAQEAVVILEGRDAARPPTPAEGSSASVEGMWRRTQTSSSASCMK